jgi:hypothetical protein
LTGVTLDSINSNTPTGCQLVDKQFSNFTSTPVGETATILMVDNSSGGTVGANSITGLVANFNDPTATAGAGWHLSPNSTVTSVFNYQGTIDQSVTPPTTGTWTVSQIALVLGFNPGNAAQIKNGDSITVKMEWCPGATVVTVGCANYQFIQGVLTKNPNLTLLYTTSANGTAGATNNSIDVSSLGDNTNFAVRNTLTFVGTANGSTLPLSFITNGFDELGIAPEPSTFVLFGMAMAGVGVLRYRRRKVA